MGGILVARQNFENQIKDDIDRINDRFDLDIKFTWGVKDSKDSEKVEDDIYNEDIAEEKGEVINE